MVPPSRGLRSSTRPFGNSHLQVLICLAHLIALEVGELEMSRAAMHTAKRVKKLEVCIEDTVGSGILDY